MVSFVGVIPTRFERVTHSLEGCCSIQLSYGTCLGCKDNLDALCFQNKSRFSLIAGFFRKNCHNF
jgi:hypothetical protein